MPRSRCFRGTGYNWIWGRPQSRPRRGEKHKNHYPCRKSNPNNPDRSLVTILTAVPKPTGSCKFFKSWRRMHAWQFVPEEQIQECFHPSLWYLRFLLPRKLRGFLPESFGFVSASCWATHVPCINSDCIVYSTKSGSVNNLVQKFEHISFLLNSL